MTGDFSCIASQGVEPPSTFSSPRQHTGPVGRDCPPWPATQTLLRRPPAHRSGQGSEHRCPIRPDGLRAEKKRGSNQEISRMHVGTPLGVPGPRSNHTGHRLRRTGAQRVPLLMRSSNKLLFIPIIV